MGMNQVVHRFKHAAIRLLSIILYYCGIVRLFNVFINRLQDKGIAGSAVRRFPHDGRPGRNLQILVYHRVNDQGDIYFPPISVEVFECQMRYISQNFNVLALEDGVRMMSEKNLVKNAISITFDDGYRDNFVYAFPVLKKYGLPATIFLASSVIGNGGMLWHDRVFSAFRETRAKVLEWPPRSGRKHPIDSQEARLSTLYVALRWIKPLGVGLREEAIFELTNALGTKELELERDIMLQWEDVREMQDHQVTFGAHTRTHPILSVLPKETAREEIHGSKEEIERHTGAVVRAFAYPNGRETDFNPQTMELLREAGFECAVTTISGTNYSGGDPYRLKRESPWETDLPLFALKRNWCKLAT